MPVRKRTAGGHRYEGMFPVKELASRMFNFHCSIIYVQKDEMNEFMENR